MECNKLCSIMRVSVSSKVFDLSAYVVVAASTYWSFSNGTRLIDGFFRGVQSFAIVSIFDKALRCLLARNVKAEVPSVKTILSPFIEETIWSGVLLTQSKIWMIPRFAASLITGMTAARSLTGRVATEQNRQGFIDTLLTRYEIQP